MRCKPLLPMLMATMMACSAVAAEVRVAVATNFRVPLDVLTEPFAKATGHRLRVSSASTGLLFAQISRGAPYDVFLAADQVRPAALVDAGLAEGPPVTYAVGRLVVIYRDGFVLDDAEPLKGVTRLSIANPRTAPYGAAAQQVLDRLGSEGFAIAQAQSVAGVSAAVFAGAVDAGFAAFTAVSQTSPPRQFWRVPRDLHDPIRQDGVVLNRAVDRAAAATFLTWLQGEEARAIIKAYGYDVD